jgi:hypothetical protein
MTWNQVLETGGVAIGKKVKLDLEVEALKEASVGILLRSRVDVVVEVEQVVGVVGALNVDEALVVVAVTLPHHTGVVGGEEVCVPPIAQVRLQQLEGLRTQAMVASVSAGSAH